MKLLYFLMRHSKGVIILAALIGIISGASSALLMALINAKLGGGTAASNPNLVWYFVVIVGVTLVSNYVSRVLLSRIAQQAIFDLRMNLCRQVLASPLRRLEEIGSHRILATLTQDIPTITRAFLDLPFFCINLTIVVCCLVYLGWLSATVLGGLLVFLVLGMCGLVLPKRKADKVWRRAREEADTLFDHFRALTSGIKELRLHRPRREAFVAARLEASAATYRDHQVEAGQLYALSGGWGFALYFVFMGFLLFMLPSMVETSVQTLTGYTITALYLRAPLVSVLDLFTTFGQAKMSLQKFDELGLSLDKDTPKELSGGPSEGASREAEWKSIQLSEVIHTYYREGTESNFILGPINLKFERGEMVFLMGGNGSGKTTLAKLLTGLYTPEGGTILVDDKPVDDHNREEYRQLFSTVFSDFYLFELLGLDKSDLTERAQAYLARLQLTHKTEIQGDRFSTTELSQGQRKRLALLTAYLEDRSVYVFDEWAADQDPYFRDVFYLELLPELKAKGKTVIIISHDDRYTHVADRLVKLDYGLIETDRRLDSSERAGALASV
ncbi:MAG TPA: cyclic peptide export ABC transporter [Pyrinomonadaceae bacterium]|nr:cyclic peptide export ABC transporter [Pyrinomonadaceae bacterium]